MIYVFFAPGFEEVEALGPIDVCRRAGLEVITVSITDELTVMGAHGIPVVADSLFADNDYSDADMIFLPGGMPGATNLNAHEGLRKVILAHHEAGKPLAAICAAPLVYGNLGLAEGKRMTCYPGFEQYLTGATCTAALVERDGLMFTGKGPAAALALGYAIVEHFCGVGTAEQLKQGMVYNDLWNGR
ncbi:MAG: DJ-1/PfpI family protein [Bacteroidaceae bacterium]|nr:DJ-1/PfpI family protein [Bacteroidaceae bacterium]